jgi:hypothetical protein
MGKSTSRWIISRIRGSKADQIGVVVAPDAAKAISKAVADFLIEPEDRPRVAARPES